MEICQAGARTGVAATCTDTATRARNSTVETGDESWFVSLAIRQKILKGIETKRQYDLMRRKVGRVIFASACRSCIPGDIGRVDSCGHRAHCAIAPCGRQKVAIDINTEVTPGLNRTGKGWI